MHRTRFVSFRDRRSIFTFCKATTLSSVHVLYYFIAINVCIRTTTFQGLVYIVRRPRKLSPRPKKEYIQGGRRSFITIPLRVITAHYHKSDFTLFLAAAHIRAIGHQCFDSHQRYSEFIFIGTSQLFSDASVLSQPLKTG